MGIPVAAEIIPLARLKNDLDFFTYAIPSAQQNDMKAGQLVTIPFRSKKIDGIVLRLIDEAPNLGYPLKDVIAIREATPLLDHSELELVKRMSEYYLVSMATIAATIVPDVPKRTRAVIPEQLLEQIIPFAGAPTTIDLNGLNNRLIRYRRENTKAALVQSMLQSLQDGEQLLIVVPELADIERMLSYIPEAKTKTVIYVQDLPMNRYWQNWQKVRGGESQVIIGTRSALFAPFKNLAHIIIDKEDHELHKQEEPAPRYRVQTVARWLCEFHGATITYLSESPSVEQLHRVAQKEIEYHEFDRDAELPAVTVIDSNKERHAGNYSVLGLALQSAIESSGGKTLLTLNKNGFATGFYCRECKTTTRAEDSAYAGLRCKQCDGAQISFVGLGADGVAAEVAKLYPNKKIVTLNAAGALDESGDIVIATLSSSLRLDLTAYETIAALGFDIQEALGDPLISERIFLDHFKLISRSGANQRVFFQTKSPDHPYMYALSSASLKLFYAHAIGERKSFGLPPFGLPVKFLYRDNLKEAGEREIASLLATMKSLPSPVSAYPFQPMRDFYRFKTYYWSTILKIPGENLLPLLRPLRGLPVIIDVDPSSLF